ncbi:MAG: carboxymuconolactone decarboxylase family protein [Chitinophagaceae bacterium]
MAHIQLTNEQLPGIVGLLDYRPETGAPLSQLAEVLLRGSSSLTPGEREIIASSVSFKNGCHFCHTSHGAAAAHHFGGDLGLIEEIKKDLPHTPISPKLRALIHIADQVRMGGKKVTREDIASARQLGATDLEIHDTVLIAAAFCMYNRYVDGLDTWSPQEDSAYDAMGKRLAHQGYLHV